MTKDVRTVEESTPIYEAMRILVERKITGVPVVSEDRRVIGMLSEKDMLNLLDNPRLDETTVKDHMTCDVVCADESDHLVDICERLMTSSFRRIPILADGKLAGVISRSDIIRFTLQARKQDKASD